MISRRDMLAGMGGLPFARPDQHYEPPDAGLVPGSRTSILRAREVIITPGAGNANGLFVYNGPAAFDNLIASITAANVHDGKGNLTLAPVSVYDPAGSPEIVMNLTGEGLNWSTAPTQAGPWSFLASFQTDHSANFTLSGSNTLTVSGRLFVLNGVSISAGGLIVVGGITADVAAISSGQAGGLVLHVTNTTANPTSPNVRIDSQAAGDPALGIRITGDSFNRLLLDDNASTGGRIRVGTGAVALDTALFRAAAATWAADPILFNNAGAAETKQAPTFANSWANSGAPGANLQFWRVAAPGNEMRWYGRITAPAGVAANQAITAAVPAAYRPAHTNFVNAIDVTSGAAIRISFGSTGVLTYQSGAVAADVIDVNGLISLDA